MLFCMTGVGLIIADKNYEDKRKDDWLVLEMDCKLLYNTSNMFQISTRVSRIRFNTKFYRLFYVDFSGFALERQSFDSIKCSSNLCITNRYN
jgi:uncharacterized membrane protein SirB2